MNYGARPTGGVRPAKPGAVAATRMTPPRRSIARPGSRVLSHRPRYRIFVPRGPSSSAATPAATWHDLRRDGGITVPGRFGTRIGDSVVVTKDGFEYHHHLQPTVLWEKGHAVGQPGNPPAHSREFPRSAGERKLDELVAPSFGVITGFQHLLADVEALARRLGECMAGPFAARSTGREPGRPGAASMALAAAFGMAAVAARFIERMLTGPTKAAAYAHHDFRDAALTGPVQAPATMSSAGPLRHPLCLQGHVFLNRHDRWLCLELILITMCGHRRLSGAGAILIGKANMHEFARHNRRKGRNAVQPMDSNRLAGGFRAALGQAVALGLPLCAVPTRADDRVPAALCGVVGLKATYGRVSLFGAVPYCWSIDHAGIIAASVEDAAEVLKVIAGYDARDPASADTPVEDYPAALAGPSPSRIGVIRPSAMPAMDASVEDAYRGAVAQFA